MEEKNSSQFQIVYSVLDCIRHIIIMIIIMRGKQQQKFHINYLKDKPKTKKLTKKLLFSWLM